MEVGQKKLGSDKVKISYSTYHKVSNSVWSLLPKVATNNQAYFLHTHFHPVSFDEPVYEMFHVSCQS